MLSDTVDDSRILTVGGERSFPHTPPTREENKDGSTSREPLCSGRGQSLRSLGPVIEERRRPMGGGLCHENRDQLNQSVIVDLR